MREKTFEEMIADNFSSLRKTVNLQIQESQQIPNRVNLTKTKLQFILIKLPKTNGKETILMAVRGNKDRGLHCSKN